MKFYEVLTIFVYVILLLIFYFGYFRGLTEAYYMDKLTLSTSTKQAKTLPFPTVLLCPSPGFKPGSNYLTQIYQGKAWWLNESVTLPAPNQTIWQVYESMSFIINRDFKLKFDNLMTSSMTYEIKEIASLSGMCYKIQSNGTLHDVPARNDFIQIEIMNGEGPDFFEVYLASNMSWQGVFSNDWPRFEPSTFILKKDVSYIANLYQLDYVSLNGNFDVDQCLKEVLKQRNCSKLCSPIIFNHLNIETCQTIKESSCQIAKDQFNDFRQCYIPQIRSEFRIRGNEVIDKKDKQFASFVLAMGSDHVTVQEEMYAMEFAQYIGSVGGTLGMFVGFSFFAYVKTCLEYFTKYIQ